MCVKINLLVFLCLIILCMVDVMGVLLDNCYNYMCDMQQGFVLLNMLLIMLDKDMLVLFLFNVMCLVDNYGDVLIVLKGLVGMQVFLGVLMLML